MMTKINGFLKFIHLEGSIIGREPITVECMFCQNGPFLHVLAHCDTRGKQPAG